VTKKISFEIEGLSAEYGKKPILKDISFGCLGGNFVGIIGPNGAGKTTLMKIMAGLLDEYTGSVSVNTKCLSKWDRTDLARERGYLPQNRNIYWSLTVEKVIQLGQLQYANQWNTDLDTSPTSVSDIIKDTGLEHLQFRKVDTLSGGELAQVLLARLLVGDPRIVLADEPVSGLDPSHCLQVMERLQALAVDGALVICVTHDLVLASRFCDRLILLDNGKVLADGDPDKVLSEKNLYAAYGVKAIDIICDGETAIVPWSRTEKPMS
jgi:iron complex transport system ATP-binding protein